MVMIVISRILLLFIVFVITFSTVKAQLKFHKATIQLSKNFTLSDAAMLGVEMDHGAVISETSVQGVINDFIIDTLQKLQIPFTIDQADLAKMYAHRLIQEKEDYSLYSTHFTKKLFGSMGSFLTLQEIYEIFTEIENKYPTLIRKETIGVTYEGRAIYAYHIGMDTVKDSKVLPRTLITSLHHAREAITATISCFFVQDFFEKVENNDPFCLYVLKNAPITIIPCLNPDGYEYNRTTNPNGGGMWRKNRRPNTNTSGIGVDPNRNYGPKEFWNSINGGSATFGSSDTYRGDSAFSEAETKAMKQIAETYNFKCALNFHSYSDLIVRPVSYSGSNPPDEKPYHYFCAHHSEKSNYPFGLDLQMVNYPARGTSDDYLYLGIPNKKIISITPEVGNFSDGFWPRTSRIYPLVQTNLPAIYAALRTTIAVPYLYSYSSRSISNVIDTQVFTLQFANTSLEPTKQCELRYSLLSTTSQSSVTEKYDTLPSMAPSETLTRSFSATGGGRPPVFGHNDGVIIEQKYDQFSLYDTLYFNIHQRKEYSLYNGEPTTASSALKGWEIEFDTKDSTYSLTESVNSNSQTNIMSSAETQQQISLEGCVDAYIEFDSKWDFEANGDAAIVYFKDQDSINITPLRSERMQNFSNGNTPLYPIGTPILNGNFRERIVQRANLNRFLGRKGVVGFQVRTNSGFTYNGFNLYKAKIVTHNTNITDLTKTEIQSITVQDSYGVISFSITREHKPLNPIVQLSIYNLSGKALFSNSYEWGSENYKGISISNDLLPVGVYLVSVVIDGESVNQIFTVIR
jgi:carboxypeptidase T